MKTEEPFHGVLLRFFPVRDGFSRICAEKDTKGKAPDDRHAGAAIQEKSDEK